MVPTDRKMDTSTDLYQKLRYKYPGHRQCCVYNCSNSGPKLAEWLKIQCSIHQCPHDLFKCDCVPPFLLFPFPTEKADPNARNIWTKQVNRQDQLDRSKIWKPNADSRICSVHFVDGTPTQSNPYPSLKLGHHFGSMAHKRKSPFKRYTSPKKLKLTIPSVECHVQSTSMSKSYTPATCSEPEVHEQTYTCTATDHDYWVTSENVAQSSSCDLCTYLGRQVGFLKGQVKCLKREVHFLKTKLIEKERKPFGEKNIESDRQTRFYTGLPTREVFDTLFAELYPKVSKLRYWHSTRVTCNRVRKFLKSPKKFGPKRILTAKDEFLLTLMKLRLGLLNEDLGDRFGVSMATVSRILTTWIKFLAGELKCLIYHPAMEEVSSFIPPSFKSAGLGKVHHIIDCSEVFLETPRDPLAAALTWSDYKHHHTAKFLVDILPNGQFNFVSVSYGGRASDKFITKDCGFLNLVEPETEVMADKGFSSIDEDLGLRLARLQVPPGKRGALQLTKEQTRKTKLIANKRIYVEQAIRRLKTFRILKYEIPLTLISLLDDMLQICGSICNMYPPLVKK